MAQPKGRSERYFPLGYLRPQICFGQFGPVARLHSHRARTAQQPHRQGENRRKQREYAGQRDSDQPEREGDQPDERIRDQCQDRQRPAQDEKNAPQEKCSHVRLLLYYVSARVEVPSATNSCKCSLRPIEAGTSASSSISSSSTCERSTRPSA